MSEAVTDAPRGTAERMPLLEHLRELRKRLTISLVAVGIGMFIGLIFYQPLFQLLSAPIQLVFQEGEPANAMEAFYADATYPMRSMFGEAEVGGKLAIRGPLEGIYTVLHVGLLGGLVLALPVVAHQFWRFVGPGLYKSERRLVVPLAFFSWLLFVSGMVFCYLIIFPVTFPFFLSVLGTQSEISPAELVQTVVKMMATFGLCFQLPVVVWFLARLGLIDHRDMLKGFRYALVGIFLAAALLTPPEILTQVLLSMPLFLLYGMGVVIAWMVSTKKRD